MSGHQIISSLLECAILIMSQIDIIRSLCGDPLYHYVAHDIGPTMPK